LRSLVKFVQRGGKLETHSDIPEDIRTQLYAEEQQHLDRKRKRRDSDSSPAGHTPMIINNYIPGHSSQVPVDGSKSTIDVTNSFSRSPCLRIPGLRDDAVDAYCEGTERDVRRSRPGSTNAPLKFHPRRIAGDDTAHLTNASSQSTIVGKISKRHLANSLPLGACRRPKARRLSVHSMPATT
jgi:hypothetical protein